MACVRGVLPQKSGSHLDRVSTVSGRDLNSDQHAIFLTILAHIVDQVATAPCTDPVQAHFLTFEAKLSVSLTPELWKS